MTMSQTIPDQLEVGEPQEASQTPEGLPISAAIDALWEDAQRRRTQKQKALRSPGGDPEHRSSRRFLQD
jgi:hypothetical protein